MARILYKGKMTGLKIPLPSGDIIVNAGDVFEVKGKDLEHMTKVMDISKEQCNSIAHQAFILEDEYEVAVGKGLVVKFPEVRTPRVPEPPAFPNPEEIEPSADEPAPPVIDDVDELDSCKKSDLYKMYRDVVDLEWKMKRGDMLAKIEDYLATKED